MHYREDRQSGGNQGPLVGRPRGAAWRALQADGVVWEGQVLLVGFEVDLAARLIVTHRRLAIARGGEVVLEVPRGWLWPAPIQRRDGVVVLSINPPGTSPFAEPETIAVRMRDGHPAAGHLIALLAKSGARLIPSDPLTAGDLVAGGLPPPPEPARSEPPKRPLRAGQDARVVPAAPEFPWDPKPSPFGDAPSSSPIRSNPPPLEPVVRPTPPPAATGRDRDWNLQPIKSMVPRASRRRRGWMLRLGGLVVLLALAAYAGSGRMPSRSDDNGSKRVPAAPRVTTVAQVPPPPTTIAPEAAAVRTAVALGVGGPDATATATPTAQPPTTEPTQRPDPLPTATPVPPETAASAPQPRSAPVPTSAPLPEVAQPLTAAPPTATLAPPTATNTAVPAPTSTSTPSPAPTPPRAAGTEAPPQPPSVGPNEVPDQALVVGPLRYTIEVAKRGASLPEFGLPVSEYGEWVALIVRVQNHSDEPAQLAMADFRLQALPNGDISVLDVGTDVIAGVVGLDPAFGSADVVRFRPGQERRLALIFLVAPRTESVTLLVGEAALDLEPALAESRPLSALDLDASVPAPEMVEATVVDVLDGERLAVELNGERTELRYLGIDAPNGEACYADEAGAINAELVEGQTVWLERERSNEDDAGQLLRDVWVAGADGERLLVAARLVEQGAAVPEPDAPNTRYAGWLAAAATSAQANGAGLWGACPTESAAASEAVAARPFLGVFRDGAWRGRDR